MSRQESDREDLLREATALVERAELTLPQLREPVVAGFRRDGSASFYFGADRVYQFNSAGQLRRAYLGGLLYKARHGRLWNMRRARTASEASLISAELTDAQTTHFLAEMGGRLEQLQAELEHGRAVLIGQVPADGQVLARVLSWLAARPAQISIASRPNAE